MFSLRHFAYATVFLLMYVGPGSAEPDFDVTEIDVDLELASLPLPPNIEPAETSDILKVEASSGALRDRSAYLPVIVQEAAANGVPPAVVDAVVRIESRYNPTAVGSAGEVGLMQVRPKTAALLGFQGSSADLAEPQTNLRYGVSYLAKAWDLAGGDLCRALMKYRAGLGAEKMSALSVEYCRRARLHLAAVGIEFAFPDVGRARPSIQVRKDVLQRRQRHTATAAIERGDHVNRSKRTHAIAAASTARTTAAWAGVAFHRKLRLVRLVRHASTRITHIKLRAPRYWVAYR